PGFGIGVFAQGADAERKLSASAARALAVEQFQSAAVRVHQPQTLPATCTVCSGSRVRGAFGLATNDLSRGVPVAAWVLWFERGGDDKVGEGASGSGGGRGIHFCNSKFCGAGCVCKIRHRAQDRLGAVSGEKLRIFWVKANKLLPVHSGGDIRSFNIAR